MYVKVKTNKKNYEKQNKESIRGDESHLIRQKRDYQIKERENASLAKYKVTMRLPCLWAYSRGKQGLLW